MMMLSAWLIGRASEWGRQYGMEYAEVYRVDRVCGLEAVVQRESIPLVGMEHEPMHNRAWFEVT